MRRTRRADGSDAGRPTDPMHVAFGERVRTLMAERGLTVKETARRVREQLPGEKFSSAHVAVYRQGRAIPRPRYLDALSLALGVDPADLVRPPAPAAAGPPAVPPSEPETSRDVPAAPPVGHVLRLESSGTLARIHLEVQVPWETALTILNLLRGASEAK